MGLQADIKAAIDGGRDDLIEALATHRLLPTVVDRGGTGGSSLLGKRTGPVIRFDPQTEGSGGLDRQTTVLVVDALGIDSEADCEAIREGVRSHPAWDDS